MLFKVAASKCVMWLHQKGHMCISASLALCSDGERGTAFGNGTTGTLYETATSSCAWIFLISSSKEKVIIDLHYVIMILLRLDVS